MLASFDIQPKASVVVTALSDLLREHLPDGWSYKRVAREAAAHGIDLGESTATAYLGGRHGTPTEAVLVAFADVLGIPIDTLRRAAGLRTGEREPYVPPADANRLNRRQRDAVDELIKSMVEANDFEAGMQIALQTGQFTVEGPVDGALFQAIKRVGRGEAVVMELAENVGDGMSRLTVKVGESERDDLAKRRKKRTDPQPTAVDSSGSAQEPQQDDHSNLAGAARKGETIERRRRRLEVQPEDEPQGDAPEGGA